MKQMKRILLIFITIILIIPAISISENDPIVGCWYIVIDVKGSILESSFPDITKMVVILSFEETGEIIFAEMDFKGLQVEMKNPAVWGKWEKNGSDYSTSFIAVGKEKAFFEDDLLYVAAFSTSMFFGFRKMETLDFYYNIYRNQ